MVKFSRRGRKGLTEDKNFTAINKMIRICRMHRGMLETSVGTLGLQRTAHRTLMYISKRGKITSQKELAAFLEISPAAVTGVLQRLEADGYVSRTLGEDNRFNEISITEKGKETVTRSCEMFRTLDASLFTDFTPEEMDDFIILLDKIRKNAEQNLSCEKAEE